MISRSPSTHIVLHLGGGYRDRADAVIKLLHRNNARWHVFVSSENPKVDEYYARNGINIIHDTSAWDTVTNFTHTLRRIQAVFNPTFVHVVTHDFHMARSMAIARAVYWRTGITPIAEPCLGNHKSEDKKLLIQDSARAWIWRLTGVLFYWKKIRQQRKGVITSGTSWREIGL